MLYCVPFPDSLTTIHTWAHLDLATHMKTSWVNEPQVALMTQNSVLKMLEKVLKIGNF